MKKTMFVAIAMVFTISISAGNPNFYQAMGAALGEFSQCKTVDDYQALGNKFLVIANAEKDEWLPLYYHAQCNIILNYNSGGDPVKQDEYLDIAKESINKMIKLAPQECEAHVLEGLLYSARLQVNPMERGQKYSQLSARSVGKALHLDPENPRARYMKIANEMGTAQFFGNDTSVFCKDAKALNDSWDEYKLKSPIYPQWGKNQVEDIVKACK